MHFALTIFARNSRESCIQDWCVILGLIVHATLIVPKYDNAGFGADRISVFVMFDDKDIYRRKYFPDTPRAMDL